MVAIYTSTGGLLEGLLASFSSTAGQALYLDDPEASLASWRALLALIRSAEGLVVGVWSIDVAGGRIQ